MISKKKWKIDIKKIQNLKVYIMSKYVYLDQIKKKLINYTKMETKKLKKWINYKNKDKNKN